MRHSIVAALMAATALVPGAASAQREGRDGFTDRGAARQAARQQAAPQPDAASIQTAPEASSRPRFDRSERAAARGDQFRGDRGGGFRADAGVAAEARGERGGQVRGNRPDLDRSDFNRPDRADGTGRFDRGAGRADRGGLTGVPSVDRNTPRADRGAGWAGNADRRSDRRNWNGVGNTDRGDARSGAWRNDGNRGNWNNGNRGNWNRNWRQDDRYDWNRRRQYDRNAYHLPRYYAPSGWNSGYRRFGIGFTLSSLLFRQSYWIGDPYSYGLPDAYGSYRWVRYYNDALLVDIYTGQVVDTVYDIFW